MSIKATVKDYMDYTTFHGVGRTKNSPYWFLRVFWVLALCGSFGIIVWQINDLHEKYKSYPISTSIEVKTASALEFPAVVICNTNPAVWRSIPEDSNLMNIIQEASDKFSIDLTLFNTSDLYGYNYSTYDQASKNKSISHDILLKTAEQFKMYMSVLDEATLLNMTQPKDEFILLCNFAGEECSGEAVQHLRTYHHGMCYKFDPEMQQSIFPFGKVSAIGPSYSLEVLLHIDQSESVPFVTSSAGAVIGIMYDEFYFHPEQSIFVPTGFETNIALSLVTKDSVPGKKKRKRCNDADFYEPLMDCQTKHTQVDIANHCGCYQFFFDVGRLNKSVPLNKTFDESGRWRPCYTEEDYKCIQERRIAYIQSAPEGHGTCLAPCRGVVYERDISMVSWPDETYIPILRRIMQAKVDSIESSRIDRNFVRGNLALVRIYLSSLSYQHVQEEYTYSEVDFMSDIGGQLGLWIGCSVLSVCEVAELIVLLVASVRAKKANAESPKSSRKDMRDSVNEEECAEESNDAL